MLAVPAIAYFATRPWVSSDAVALAIGTAWSGLLANFAAGVFMVVLRPFKIGDMISAGGVTGDAGSAGGGSDGTPRPVVPAAA